MNKKNHIFRTISMVLVISTIVLIWLLMVTFLGLGNYIIGMAELLLPIVRLIIILIYLISIASSFYITFLFLYNLFDIKTKMRSVLIFSFGAIITGAISGALIFIPIFIITL